MSACKFEFDHVDNLYYSGDKVIVEVHLTTTIPLQEVCIHFYGEVRVSFRCDDDVEVYLDKKDIVFGQDNSSALPPGTHQFSAIAELPANTASSWHESFGSVQYACHVIFEDTEGAVTKFTEPFTVVRALSLSLNNLIRYSLPASDVFVRQLYLSNLPKGSIHTKVKLPKRLFMCDEYIPLKITINNNSSTCQRHCIIAELEQDIKFTIRTLPFSLIKRVCHLRLDAACAAGSQVQLEGTLQIPLVTPSTWDGQFLISYTLNVFVYASGRSRNKIFNFPLAIGVMSDESHPRNSNSGCLLKNLWRRCICQGY